MKYILPTFITLYIFSLIGELGSLWWVFDLFSHWRSVYLIVGSVLLVWTLLVRQQKWAFTTGVVLFYHLIVVAAYVQISPSTVVKAEEVPFSSEELSVAFVNSYWKNPDMNQVVAGIEKMNTDVVFLIEIQPEQYTEVRTQLPAYQYGLHVPVEWAFDMGVISKVPIKSHQIHYFMAEVPLIEVVVEQNGKELHLMGVHPHSPVTAEFASDRNKYLETLFEYVDSAQTSIVMGGDFNITQFSPVFRELVQDSRMVDTQSQFLLTNTWPSHAPDWVGIPIDQVFVTPDVKVSKRYKGAFTGSDHWPIVVHVSL